MYISVTQVLEHARSLIAACRHRAEFSQVDVAIREKRLVADRSADIVMTIMADFIGQQEQEISKISEHFSNLLIASGHESSAKALAEEARRVNDDLRAKLASRRAALGVFDEFGMPLDAPVLGNDQSYSRCSASH